MRGELAPRQTDARPRFGTFVTERSRWQLLDNDVMKWGSRNDPDPVLVLELGEVRQVIEPADARMAVARRTPLAFKQIESISFLAQHADVCDAIRSRDSDAAFATMKLLMDSAAEDTALILRAQGAQATLAARPPAL